MASALARPGAAALYRQTRLASHASPLTLSRLLPIGTGRKLMSNIPDYKKKYEKQLQQEMRRHKVGSVDELIQAARTEAAKSPRATKTTGQTESAPMQGQAPAAEPSAARKLDRESHLSANNLPPSAKSLDQIIVMDSVADKGPEEIGQIWTKYHGAKDMISAVVPAATYGQIRQVARANPRFVLPLPREEGVEFYFLQFDHHQVHFTSLLEYKTNQSHARPFLTLTHYTDFGPAKGIVLMRGEVDGESRHLDTANAQYLALQLQQFYVTGGAEKRALLEKFNQHPDQFDYRELIAAAEKL
ncbi:hypothetical protein GGF46_001061 [Coemansia sp. RSA 552]|nr:hypothetical protein GGF46_001061 [Coemansia sp. RSA 552]